MSLLKTRLRWQQLSRSDRPTRLKIAILASFTAHPLAPYLGVALEEADWSAQIWCGPYNQIVPELLSAGSETARFQPDVLICWPRLEELWNGRPWPLNDPYKNYTEEILEVASVGFKAAQEWKATLLFVLPALPELRPLGVGDANNLNGVMATATAVRETLRQRLANQPGVLLLDMEEIVRSIGSSHAYHPSLFATARIPFTEETFSTVGQRMARLIRLSREAARKVLVVDGDNTLWGGVVGEEGVAGIDLADNGPGEAYREMQAFLLELRRSGVLLALSSKNNENEVWEVMARPDMRLKREHLSAWRVNWQPKSVSLAEIAAELNLGLSSFAFLDDSPVELSEVQTALPHLATLQMPADPTLWPSVFQNSGLLDRLPPTGEDLQRAEQYEQERQRSELKQALSHEEYLASLQVEVDLSEPTLNTLPRLAQLVAKTNQFNLNCRRRSESELAALCRDETYIVRTVGVRDRFGDYGVVGAFILEIGTAGAIVDTFLLSCRAMGRNIENAMIAAIFKEVARHSISTVFATVEDQPKNEPAKRFFSELGCEVIGQPARLQNLEWPSHIQLNVAEGLHK